MLNLIEMHPLFEHMSKESIERLLNCFDVQIKNYKKDEYIVLAGGRIDFIGIPLTGQVFMESIDYFGNSYIYTEIRQNSMFGEVFISSPAQRSTVNYKSITDSSILFIKTEPILHLCKNNCPYHQILIENLVSLLAQKSRTLIDKIEIISSKTIRERILIYLFKLSDLQKSRTVISPLNHKELACFLSVNRSSMQRELHQMKEDHLIDYNKNLYVLIDAVYSNNRMNELG